jgi:hypothetical protein
MTKRFLSLAVSATTLAGFIGVSAAAGSSPASAAGPNIRQTWSRSFADGSGVIALSSPIVATLDGGGPAAVVGDRAGNLYALHLSDGSNVAGSWPAGTGGIAIDSAPSNTGTSIYVGEGTSAHSTLGGYAKFGPTGGNNPKVQPAQMIPGSGTAGVQSGLAIGNLEGQLDVVSGSMGQFSYALNSDTMGVLPGWPFLNADSDFTTPAIADLYSNRQNEVVEGSDSTFNPVARDQLNNTYPSGGHIRVISGSGALLCEYQTNQVVQSSPAVGEFLGNGQVGIVAGTGSYYAGASDTNTLIGLNNRCGQMWKTTLDGDTVSSPIVASAQGGSALQVAEGTWFGPAASPQGTVYLVNGATGGVIWQRAALGGIMGGLASVDLGGGYQDIVATTTGGVEIFDGKTGDVVWSALHGTLAFQNSPLVTADPDGNVGITVAGYSGSGSAVYHFEVVGDPAGRATEAGSWPMFHHDPQLTGDAGTPPPPSIEVPCSAPRSPVGYWMTASDGGIFNYGNLPFCGSTGAVALARPIVGLAGTTNAGGYWTVASDGGIFAFGNAHFYGSTGGIALARPVVGMARTPDGNGYWLVASDGGIFSYGDAHFYGSTGGIRLAQPIVGMIPTPTGHGYWLVASDGGIFSYGDAHFYGSTGAIRLNRPIVGAAATPGGGGYWLVASDGGIFSFGNAKFHGSTGAIVLARPVVGMSATPDGGGYWTVASDGGIFAFGDAHFYGSAGGHPLNRPVVAMTGV